jgi:hypothetical protein
MSHGFVNTYVLKAALQELVKTPLYIEHGVTLREDWDENLLDVDSNLETASSSTFECDVDVEGNLDEDTMVMGDMSAEELRTHTLNAAPAEGNRAQSLLMVDNVEELCFPDIFGRYERQRAHGYNQMMGYPHICRAELRSYDRRCSSNVSNLFFKLSLLQMRQVMQISTFRLRRGILAQNGNNRYSAKHCYRHTT